MSFGVTSEDFSWGVDDYLSLRFLRNPQKIRLLFEIIRFNRLAKNIQSMDSIDSWLDQKKFSKFLKTIIFFLCLLQFGHLQERL